MSKKIKIGLIGLGNRGYGLLSVLVRMDDIMISAVSDSYEDRMLKPIKLMVFITKLNSNGKNNGIIWSNTGGNMTTPCGKTIIPTATMVTEELITLLSLLLLTALNGRWKHPSMYTIWPPGCR